MILTIVSFDGLALNNASFASWFPDDDFSFFNLPGVDAQEVAVSGTWPELSAVERKAKRFKLSIESLGTFSTQLDTLKGTFDTKKSGLRKLLLVDGSAKQWYVMAKVISHDVIEASYNEFTLHAPNPTLYSESTTATVQVVTATGQTWNVTPVGNDTEIKPVITVLANNALTGGYANKIYRPILNPIDRAFVDYPFDLMSAGWNTATLVGGGNVQADGDDVRVVIDGVEVERWLSGMNSANTKVVTILNLQPRVSLTLSGSITNVATVTEMTFQNTGANKAALKKLPAGGGKITHGGEVFSYTAVNYEKRKLTISGRAVNGTTAAAHADGDAFDWVQFDCWVLYGNAAATAPEQTNLKQPMFDLASSTNTSWVYTSFTDGRGLRAGAWKARVIKGTGSAVGSNSGTRTYTGNQGANADPATEMGMAIAAYQSASGWRADDGDLEFGLYHPAGITHVASSSGEIRRVLTSFPAAQLLKSLNGTSYSTQYTIAQPTAANTWQAWSKGSEALGATYNYLKYRFSGVVKGATANEADFEVEAVTVTIDSARVPYCPLAISAAANYHLDCTITNNLTGKVLPLRWTMQTTKSLVIDTLNRTIVYDGAVNALGALGEFSRADWLDLTGGVANQIQFDQVGTNNVTVTFTFRDAYV